jgi:hypothetical protein
MQECIIHIQLVQRPVAGESNTENYSYSGRFNDRAKCLSIIKAVFMIISLSYKPCFVAFNAAISFSFNFKQQFTSNCMSIGGKWYQILGRVECKDSKFISHSVTPQNNLKRIGVLNPATYARRDVRTKG